MNHNLFICLPLVGHLGCSQFGDITNKAVNEHLCKKGGKGVIAHEISKLFRNSVPGTLDKDQIIMLFIIPNSSFRSWRRITISKISSWNPQTILCSLVLAHRFFSSWYVLSIYVQLYSELQESRDTVPFVHSYTQIDLQHLSHSRAQMYVESKLDLGEKCRVMRNTSTSLSEGNKLMVLVGGWF